MATLTELAIDKMVSSDNYSPIIPIQTYLSEPNTVETPKTIKKPSYHLKLEDYISNQIPENQTSVTDTLYDLADTLKGTKKGVKRIRNWHFRLNHAQEVISNLENKIKDNLEQGVITKDYANNALEKAKDMIDIATSSKYFKQNYSQTNESKELNNKFKKVEANVYKYDRIEDIINEPSTDKRIRGIQSNLLINVENPSFVDYVRSNQTIKSKVKNLKNRFDKAVVKGAIKVIDYVGTPKSMKPSFQSFEETIDKDMRTDAEIIANSTRKEETPIQETIKKKRKFSIPKAAAVFVGTTALASSIWSLFSNK